MYLFLDAKISTAWAVYWHHLLRAAIFGGIYGGVLGAAGMHFKIARLLPEIRKRVGGVCIHCGYDLRATPDACPECGAAKGDLPNRAGNHVKRRKRHLE